MPSLADRAWSMFCLLTGGHKYQHTRIGHMLGRGYECRRCGWRIG